MKLRKLIITVFILSVFTAAMCAYGQESQETDDLESKLAQMKKQLKTKEDEHNFHPGVASSPGFPFQSARKDVLVIPSSGISSEKLDEITEDMAVMGRILDKQTPGYNSWLSWSNQSIFLEGYGALFLMNVNFPLLPIEKPQPEQVEKEEVDPLWEQTKKELDSPGFPGIVIPKPRPFGGESSAKYDEEKVESLKSSLIKALKYAANIRALKSDDIVIVTAVGAGQSQSGSIQQNIIIKSSGNSVIQKSSGAPSMSYSAGVLTIRAKKSDIDAFSKGELDFEQFSQRATVLIY